MDRTKAEPICFRPKLAMVGSIERLAGDNGMTLAQWLEHIAEQEVYRHAAAPQGTPGPHDSALAV